MGDKEKPYITIGVHINKNDKTDMEIYRFVKEQAGDGSLGGFIKKVLFAYMVGARLPAAPPAPPPDPEPEPEEPKLEMSDEDWAANDNLFG